MWTRDPHELLLMEARAAQELFKTADFADRRRKRGTQKENPRKSAVIPPTLRPFDKPFRQAEALAFDSEEINAIVHELLHFSVPSHGKPWKSLMRAHFGGVCGDGSPGCVRQLTDGSGGGSLPEPVRPRAERRDKGWNRGGARGEMGSFQSSVAPAASSPVRMTNGAGAGRAAS